MLPDLTMCAFAQGGHMVQSEFPLIAFPLMIICHYLDAFSASIRKLASQY